MVKNTGKKGRVRTLIFKEGATWYGVALEFNIVLSGDDADVVSFNLQEAIRGYVESQRKIRGSRFEPLNQKPNPEYDKLWKSAEANKPIPSPIQIVSYGHTLV